MRRVKILLLGDSNVGKTSIIARLTTGDFKTKMVQTVGVDYKPKKVNIGGENIQVLIRLLLSPHLSSFFPSPPLSQVQLWDTAGSEKFRQITTSYYRGVNGIMLCFDVSQRETYERVADWLQNIKKHASENVHVMLVGNKIDLRAERGNDPNCVHEREVKPIANKSVSFLSEDLTLTLPPLADMASPTQRLVHSPRIMSKVHSSVSCGRSCRWRPNHQALLEPGSGSLWTHL
jgi:small GTP-binding protein